MVGSTIRGPLWQHGDVKEFSATVTLPVDIEGDYYLFVATDANDNIYELDNDDNVGRSIAPMTVASLLPDLVVSGVTTSVGSQYQAGQTLALGWTVQNQGVGVTATGAWKDAVYLSLTSELSPDILLGTFSHNGALGSQQYYERWETVTLPYDASGQYWLYVETDYGDAVYEDAADLSNLSGGIGMQVNWLAADLAAGNLVTDATAVSGGTLSVQYSVTNVGQGVASERNWSDAIYLSANGQVDEQAILVKTVSHLGRLGFGGSYNVAVTCNLPVDLAGKYYVIAVADYRGDVVDSQTANNTVVSASMVDITLGAVPDLAALDVTAPTTAIGGHEIQVQYRVVIHGAGPARPIHPRRGVGSYLRQLLRRGRRHDGPVRRGACRQRHAPEHDGPADQQCQRAAPV